MDWCAWLSKTNLDAALINDYGLTLARNELREDDLPYFNHDFLQSIGISIAKHRLEILKLCRKEVGERPYNGLSRLVLVVNKTRKLFARNISKLAFHKSPSRFSPTDVAPYRSHWSGGLRRIESQQAGGNVVWSGPLDRRVSGPLDVKMGPNLSPVVGRHDERSGRACRSPTMSGPVDRLGLSPKVGYYRSEMTGDGAHSLWSIMFHDMKPT